MNDAIVLTIAVAVAATLGCLLFVVRSPSALWSLIRNPREHLFGKSDYQGGDTSGMLWDGEEFLEPIPEGFTRYDEGNPFSENTYVVIVNYDGEQLWGMLSDDIWPRRNYWYIRDEVIAYRAMTDEEVAEHEAFLEDRDA